MAALAAAPDLFGLVSTQVAAGGIDTAVTPTDWLLPGVIDGRVKCIIDSYTSPDGSTETAGKVISMGSKLPAGANVIAIMLSTSASTSSLAMAVGDYANTTRYTASIALATADVAVIIPGDGYVIGTTTWTTTYTYDNQIILTTAGATLASAQIITCVIIYALD